MFAYRSLRVALLGAGTVGSQVARLLIDEADELANRVGARLELVGIAVRDPDAPRDTPLPQELFTTDAESLILGADIVIELMGGIEPARTFVLQALGSGADVVTGNKALLATHGPELAEAAEQVGAQLAYEAAVAGAIPIIRPLRESLAGDRVERILAIVNGTTNFILDRMDSTGTSLENALATATELGYAEADPTADIGGYDAAQKAAILASLAFHTTVPLASVHREGITEISAAEVAAAADAGYVVKLLAICGRMTDPDTGEDAVSVRVHPALIPRTHPLASVRGGNNAVFVEAEAAGPLMFYGAGAGGVQTASAVLGDLVAVARRHVVGGPGLGDSAHAGLPVLDIGKVTTRYAISLDVDDQPGVLAAVAQTFARHGVSVEQLQQTTSDESGRATLVVGTHTARESALAETVAELATIPAVASVASVLRVEGAA
ncbi:homoserine dehydrogenase [Agromyces archimandritae]|uniref:Homoserine dehydrogenase n=1 Tax=Agromyces archimandritae TaxID=2781962 RepID=A0A975IP13_9MICO|nr:homoserine dehydrogenase [Agromyces archimandritae]QTX05167.1 homoserine dehydrogenase [Agromyces archimandritae]